MSRATPELLGPSASGAARDHELVFRFGSFPGFLIVILCVLICVGIPISLYLC